MSLGFFSAANQSLTKSNIGMGMNEISIQLQSMFTFSDSILRSALGEDLDAS